ncbi:MAG: molybdenum cofactor guanylyltransferase [Elusimicrobiota bacterium]
MNKNISAVVLAGGKNGRFSGFNKAFLKINGKRIIDSTLDILKNIFREIIIVTNNYADFAEFHDITVVSDIVKNCGPVGGIYTGLKTINTDYAFFVASDMPFINKNLIEQILKLAYKKNTIAVMPCSEKGLEPLFAVYNKKIITGLEKAIETEKLSITKIIEKMDYDRLKLTEDETQFLININTASDFYRYSRPFAI